MKIIKQIGIVMGLCWISLVIEKLLPFAFPASVIGMILLLICLFTGILKLEHIREKSDFLLSNMAFFFIPAGVSMINYLDILMESRPHPGDQHCQHLCHLHRSRPFHPADPEAYEREETAS